jgi:hypothetical protein
VGAASPVAATNRVNAAASATNYAQGGARVAKVPGVGCNPNPAGSLHGAGRSAREHPGRPRPGQGQFRRQRPGRHLGWCQRCVLPGHGSRPGDCADLGATGAGHDFGRDHGAHHQQVRPGNGPGRARHAGPGAPFAGGWRPARGGDDDSQRRIDAVRRAGWRQHAGPADGTGRRLQRHHQARVRHNPRPACCCSTPARCRPGTPTRPPTASSTCRRRSATCRRAPGSSSSFCFITAAPAGSAQNPFQRVLPAGVTADNSMFADGVHPRCGTRPVRQRAVRHPAQQQGWVKLSDHGDKHHEQAHLPACAGGASRAVRCNAQSGGTSRTCTVCSTSA